MASFNKVILIGNLVADPELKQTPSGVNVTSFRIAVGRKFKSAGDAQPQADFIDIVAWRQTAEFVTKYFSKGKPILVCGSIQSRNWTDQNGQKHYVTEIVADNAYFVDSRSEAPASLQGAPSYSQNPAPSYVPEGYSNGAYQNQAAPKFEEISDDEELPF